MKKLWPFVCVIFLMNCEKENLQPLAENTPELAATSRPPVWVQAHAGNDTTIYFQYFNQSVSALLNGSRSVVPANNYPVDIQWRKIAGPAQHTIQNPSSLNSLVSGLVTGIRDTTADVQSIGEYKFELRLESRGIISTDTVFIKLEKADDLRAYAGADIVLDLPIDYAQLQGSAIGPGQNIQYQWRRISGTSISGQINQANMLVTEILSRYNQYELTVSNELGMTDRDTVLISYPYNIVVANGYRRFDAFSGSVEIVVQLYQIFTGLPNIVNNRVYVKLEGTNQWIAGNSYAHYPYNPNEFTYVFADYSPVPPATLYHLELYPGANIQLWPYSPGTIDLVKIPY